MTSWGRLTPDQFRLLRDLRDAGKVDLIPVLEKYGRNDVHELGSWSYVQVFGGKSTIRVTRSGRKRLQEYLRD